jgi:hypothetical protein
MSQTSSLRGRAARSLAGAAGLATLLAACAGLTPQQDAGWVAFHACQPSARSATMEDLLTSGRVHYWTAEGVEFGSMKACMEQRGYDCDIGVTIGTRPHTYCYPRVSAR